MSLPGQPVRVVEDSRHPWRKCGATTRTTGHTREQRKRSGQRRGSSQERDWCNQVVGISKHQRQGSDPGREGNGAGPREPGNKLAGEATARAKQTPRKKRIRFRTLMQDAVGRLRQQHDRRYDRKRELESRGKEFVCVPAKDQRGGRSETIEREHLPLRQEAAQAGRRPSLRPLAPTRCADP